MLYAQGSGKNSLREKTDSMASVIYWVQLYVGMMTLTFGNLSVMIFLNLQDKLAKIDLGSKLQEKAYSAYGTGQTVVLLHEITTKLTCRYGAQRNSSKVQRFVGQCFGFIPISYFSATNSGNLFESLYNISIYSNDYHVKSK